MRILIIGNGGREHAIAWKLQFSPDVEHIYVAPGNAGTYLEPKTRNVNIAANDIEKLLKFAKDNAVQLTIVGPEAPLCEGIVDVFEQSGLACFGPSKLAAQLEGSKIFSKNFMQKYHIPTAIAKEFDDPKQAQHYIQNANTPLVIKADGLAAGKGVVIAHSKQTAYTAIHQIMVDKIYGDAGKQIIIEEFLTGQEASFMVICDGSTVLPLVNSQDHKALNDHDTGPNTGGMGAYSPTSLITGEMQEQIMETIVMPTIEGLKAEGIIYKGILYCGLMIDGPQVKVLEYNCRLGDPEAQIILMRLRTDLLRLFQSTLAGNLNQLQLDWDPRPSLGVVLAAKGYPESYTNGQVIYGLADASQKHPNVKVFHAGTKLIDEKIVSNGGRILCVTALSDTLSQTQTEAYSALHELNAKAFHYRNDIGAKALSA